MTLAARELQITITLAEGQFGDKLGNQVVLSGHRAMCTIASYGGESQGEMQLRLYGLPLSMINQLTTIGPVNTQIRKNEIQIDAGNEGEQLATVYKGIIWTAYGDFMASPDVALNVQALGAAWDAVAPTSPTSYKEAVDVSDAMSKLAALMGLSFENSDVIATVPPIYLHGTLLDQVKALAKSANINWIIDSGTLAIWSKFGTRPGYAPVVSPSSGLVGYPSFSSMGILVKTEFLPSARVGGLLTVQDSIVRGANRTWIVNQVMHELSSQMPGGPWFTNCGAYANAIVQ